MKKAIVAIAVALAVFSFSSCKKGDETSGRTGIIAGTWSMTFKGYDDNENGVWEASEKDTVTAAELWKFNSNGTGTVFSGHQLDTMNWKLINNDTYLRLIASPDEEMDTFYLNIISLTSNELIWRDTSSSPFLYAQLSKK